MTTLNQAISIAALAHEGQVDKAGQPYILHPLRVMMLLQEPEQRIVGVLHDVVEDCPAWPLERIAQVGFGADIMAALCTITRTGTVPYADYIVHVGINPLARAVKLADLADNLAPSRLGVLTESQVVRYIKARRRLEDMA